MSKVIFNKDGHKYTFISDENKKCISATSLVKKFHDDFDGNYWATYKALKSVFGEEKFKQIRNGMGYDTYPLYLKPPQDFLDNLIQSVDPRSFFAEKKKVQDDWNQSSILGTKFHDEMEQQIYDNGGLVNPWTGKFFEVVRFDKENDNESVIENLYDLEDGVYPELLVWLELDTTVIAGQIDVLFIETIDGVRYVYSDDWKTNAKLTKTSNDSYYPPFQHLNTSKITAYALQASFYNYILKSWGFTPRNQALTHFKNYDPSTGVRHDLPFYEKEVSLMIEMFNSQNQ